MDCIFQAYHKLRYHISLPNPAKVQSIKISADIMTVIIDAFSNYMYIPYTYIYTYIYIYIYIYQNVNTTALRKYSQKNVINYPCPNLLSH